MLEINSLYTPQEAWEELLAMRRNYYAVYYAPYSGDHAQLASTALNGSFWNRKGKVKLHVPIAADIASTSANMIFGNVPRYSIYDISLGKEENASQARLDEIVRVNGLNQKLQEAAEVGAANGDVYFKGNFSADGAEMPIITTVRGSDALAEYRLDKLCCIHFFSLLKTERKTGKVWRVYERYEPGVIYTMVFHGDSSDLGIEEPSVLNDLGIEYETRLPVEGILAAHIVNARPSRVWPTNEKGRSDFEGMRDLLDSLDETYTSWMRDIRLAKSRLIVPAEYLRRRESDSQMFGQGRYTYDFDEDVETLVALDISNDAHMDITPSQFAIRSQEHAETFETTLRSIISMSGYSPQTFGLDIEGNAQSGTARRIIEKKSLNTTAKKQSYWKAPFESFLTTILRLDAALYGNPKLHDDDVVNVEFHAPNLTDPVEIAGAVNLLHSAEAASKDTIVKLLHPDWTQADVDEEVKTIYSEYGVESILPDYMRGEGERT